MSDIGMNTLTDYQSILMYAEVGNVEGARREIDSVRREHAGYKHTGYETKKGHLTTRGGTHVPISAEALERFFEDVLEEAERIHVVIEAKCDVAYRAMWEEYFSDNAEMPEFSREKLQELATGKVNGEYKRDDEGKVIPETPSEEEFRRLVTRTRRDVVEDIYFDAAAFHIEQRDVDWHKAWQDYTWYPNFAALDVDPLDNERALELLEAARSKNSIDIPKAIMRQYFDHRLAFHAQVNLKDESWAARIRDEWNQEIGGRDS